ncbi:MAG: hypothetical protein JO356_18045, partial [Acidobacteria bacterium]|nr:hypothetical protein [Acidobacteriota bacterium]
AARGAAIAVTQGEQLMYCAASGVSVPEPGQPVDLGREAIRTCVEEAKPSWTERSTGLTTGLAVPVMREHKVEGLLELAGEFSVGEREQKALSRLTEMVSIALEHRDAAFQAESGLRQSELTTPELSARQVVGQIPAWPVSKPTPPPRLATKVQSCSTCGFPVSNSRVLCLDCEEKSLVPPPLVVLPRDGEESWLSRHGYTIASLLVSALAAVIIYWFRR